MRGKEESFSATARGRGRNACSTHLRAPGLNKQSHISNPDLSIFSCQSCRTRAQDCGAHPKLFRIPKRERTMRSSKALIEII